MINVENVKDLDDTLVVEGLVDFNLPEGMSEKGRMI